MKISYLEQVSSRKLRRGERGGRGGPWLVSRRYYGRTRSVELVAQAFPKLDVTPTAFGIARLNAAPRRPRGRTEDFEGRASGVTVGEVSSPRDLCVNRDSDQRAMSMAIAKSARRVLLEGGRHSSDRSGSRHTARSNSWFLCRLIFGERDRGRFNSKSPAHNDTTVVPRDISVPGVVCSWTVLSWPSRPSTCLHSCWYRQRAS